MSLGGCPAALWCDRSGGGSHDKNAGSLKMYPWVVVAMTSREAAAARGPSHAASMFT